MAEAQYNAEYLLASDEEPLRLERQAQIYGFGDDLRHLSLAPGDRVLDAGCGSGIITRAIARAAPKGFATGVDRDPKHVDFARRKASLEGIDNIRFEVGDVLHLPFEAGTFDVIWSKHLLQWVMKRDLALREFARVTRTGGRIVVCNFDYCMVCHYPVDARLQADLELWFETARQELGFDHLLGRKLPNLFLEAGLKDVKVDFIPDRAFSGLGGDPERRWNFEAQLQSSIGFSAKVFGSMQRAEQFSHAVVEQFSRPDVYVFCPLFYVEGCVP